ncbi:MAG: hypothetical protein K0U66_05530 [Gammaproteobacteria bacterium]|nr:hypothetical protein [Gammaproteobacteria bacterium]
MAKQTNSRRGKDPVSAPASGSHATSLRSHSVIRSDALNSLRNAASIRPKNPPSIDHLVSADSTGRAIILNARRFPPSGRDQPSD